MATLSVFLLVSMSAAPVPRRTRAASNPLISRGRAAFSSDGTDASVLVDGVYGVSGPGVSWSPSKLPAWVAIKLGPGFSRVLLSWNSPGNMNYTGTTGVPRDYSIEVSPDSTNGSDGTWTTAVSVTGNAVRGRTHGLGFSGQQWIRFGISNAPAGAVLDEIDVHDLSAGASDTWFFMGDSITDLVFDRAPAHQPSFAAQISQSFPAFYPAMQDGGIFGETSADGVRHIDAWLDLHPEVKYWAVGYGTNDSGRKVDPDVFQSNLQTIVNRVKSAGRIPLLARIAQPTAPGYSTIPALNEKIDALVAANKLLPGPDCYTWFLNYPNQIGADGIHPNDAGVASMNRLWVQAVASLYTTPVPDPAPTPTPTPPPPPPTTTVAATTPDTSNQPPPRKCGLLGLEGAALLALLLCCRRP